MTDRILTVLTQYRDSFSKKKMVETLGDNDILMDVFDISPQLKGMNKQYWGRELGKCWERVVIEVFRNKKGFGPAIKVGADEPCDFIFNKYAIDTKYRVGSGDSGTLKKFKQYGKLLKDHGYTPVMLFLREDNLPAAITAMKKGGWRIITGDDSFEFIQNNAEFDLKDYLFTRRSILSIL